MKFFTSDSVELPNIMFRIFGSTDCFLNCVTQTTSHHSPSKLSSYQLHPSGKSWVISSCRDEPMAQHHPHITIHQFNFRAMATKSPFSPIHDITTQGKNGQTRRKNEHFPVSPNPSSEVTIMDSVHNMRAQSTNGQFGKDSLFGQFEKKLTNDNAITLLRFACKFVVGGQSSDKMGEALIVKCFVSSLDIPVRGQRSGIVPITNNYVWYFGTQ